MIRFKSENIKDHYNLQEIIGEGAFGSVIKASSKETGEEVAIKMIKKDDLDEEDIKNIHTEVNVSANIDHPNVVKMVDSFESKSAYFIVFELMEGGELFDRIVEKECYSEAEAAKAFKPIVDAIRYCHSAGIVHRDLKVSNSIIKTSKPENLLYLEEDPESTIKVSDFGLARVLDSKNQLMSTVCGTPAYLAPEIINNEKYGPACDCWSLGVILYVLLSGYPPFDDDNNAKLVEQVKTGTFDYPSPEWDEISDEAKDMINNLLQPDPSKRLTTTGILEHPWMVKHFTEELAGFRARMIKYNSKRKLRRAQMVVYATSILKSMKKKI